MERDRLFDIVGMIYDAAIDRTLWPEALCKVADYFEAETSHFLVHDIATNTPTMFLARTDPMHIDEYFKFYADKNPWIPQFLKHPSGTVMPGDQLMPLEELRRTEFFNDHLKVRKVAHCLGVLVRKSPAVISSVTIYRGAKRGAFEQKLTDAAKLLIPHFQRAIEIGSLLRFQEARADGAFAALEKMPCGVILFDAAGKACHLNRQAETIIGRHDGLSLINGELVASLERERIAIRKIMGAALSLNLTGLGPAALGISRPSGLRSFEVVISPPQTDRTIMFGAMRPCIVAFVTDPEMEPVSFENSLRQIYGLTAKEASLAMLLLKGHRLNDAAETMGVGLETARTHLKNCLGKTGSETQADLIRTVLRGAAHLGGET